MGQNIRKAKCRIRGRPGYRLHRPLSPHLPFPSLGESAGNFGENGSLSPVADRGTGSTGPSRRTYRFHLPGKCREFPRKRFTFPRGRMGYRLYRPLWPHLAFPPPGKVPGISAKTVHFPPRHETSGEVQQGMLLKVLSIQALWKRYSAGLGVKWWICGKKRAVQQIAKIYTPNNQHNAFERCVGHCNSSY